MKASTEIYYTGDTPDRNSSEQRAKMKVWFLLFVLLPLCLDSTGVAAQYAIDCYGEDFLMVRNMVLHCKSKVQQACYTRSSGEKGCIRTEFCKRPGWKCCETNLCNA
ncbi:hypothetical protein KOW79_002669 [Hemibagrus wyckioides]|uniref:Uncharacterized protein n=2 Tax=Hemibagrus wyckioides TaxID=337641 RepID=A0A9D3P875_9TELE|nr:hypothetical protein KOW79_002669 [Hemibagrus wyckioides]